MKKNPLILTAGEVIEAEMKINKAIDSIAHVEAYDYATNLFRDAEKRGEKLYYTVNVENYRHKFEELTTLKINQSIN